MRNEKTRNEKMRRGKFSRKMELAIAALLKYRNIEEAAGAIGIGRQTLHRWMQDAEFDAQYRKAKRDSVGQARARLQKGAGAAASVLLKILVEQGVSPATRLHAAKTVLEHATNALDNEDTQARIAALERLVELGIEQ